MIIIFTPAYNAEKTLRRAINSVSHQTYNDFLYYVCNNGSKDKTGDIIRAFASQDERIIYLENELNSIGWSTLSVMKENSEKYFDNDYFCTLDADDEYAPDFLEKALTLMEGNNLDIVTCGSQFISEATGQPMDKTYSVTKDMVLSGEAFSEQFVQCCQFMWTIWGKLYRLPLLRQCSFENMGRVSYGADTLFALEAFRHASRVGILGGTHHKYYISPKSVSYKFNNKRIASDQIVFDEYLKFLAAKNAMTKNNLDYIYGVHVIALKNTLTVALRSTMEPIEKLTVIRDVLTHKYSRETLRCGAVPNSAKQHLQGDMITTMFELAKLCKGLPYDILADTLSAMASRDGLLSQASYKGFSDDEIFMLLIKLDDRLDGDADTGIVVSRLTGKYPLTQGMSITLAKLFANTVRHIMNGDYLAALDALIEASDNAEITDDDVEAYFLLGQNLGAAAEDVGAYAYFKKLWISYLIDVSRTNEAKAELDELLPLFREDEDFIELSERLSGHV